MRQNVLCLEPEFLFVTGLIAKKEDSLRLGVASSSGKRVALVFAGHAQRHTKRQSFELHTAASRRKHGQSEEEERRGEGWEKYRAEAGCEYGHGLHVSSGKGINQNLFQRPDVAQKAFPLMPFIVFKTSDFSIHRVSYCSFARASSSLAS